jgi:hypothetical protein
LHARGRQRGEKTRLYLSLPCSSALPYQSWQLSSISITDPATWTSAGLGQLSVVALEAIPALLAAEGYKAFSSTAQSTKAKMEAALIAQRDALLFIDL